MDATLKVLVSQSPRNLLFQDGALVLLYLITGHGGIKILATEMQTHTTDFRTKKNSFPSVVFFVRIFVCTDVL